MLIALLLAAPAPLSEEIKEALDVGCVKVAKAHPDSICRGIANVVEFKLQMVGVTIGPAGWDYCVEVCKQSRAKK